MIIKSLVTIERRKVTHLIREQTCYCLWKKVIDNNNTSKENPEGKV